MYLPYNIIYLTTDISETYLNWVRVHLDNKRMNMSILQYFITICEIESCI